MGGRGAISGSLAPLRGGCAAAKWRDGGGCRRGRGLARVAQGGLFFFFREGRNLIGGHSCINRGIEEFCVGLMELTLHEWPPLPLPPKMGHFPHVSENMTTSPKPKAGSGRPARGKLRSFSRAVKFSFSSPVTSSSPPPSLLHPSPPPSISPAVLAEDLIQAPLPDLSKAAPVLWKKPETK